MSEQQDQGASVSMLERMAQGWWEAREAHFPARVRLRWDQGSPIAKEQIMRQCAAALEAIREPSAEVAEAGMIAGSFNGYADVAFTAMIDAIRQGNA